MEIAHIPSFIWAIAVGVLACIKVGLAIYAFRLRGRNNTLNAELKRIGENLSDTQFKLTVASGRLSLAVCFIANYVRQRDITISLHNRAVALDDCCRASIDMQQANGDPEKAVDACNSRVAAIDALKRNFFNLFDRVNEIARELPATCLIPYEGKSFKDFLRSPEPVEGAAKPTVAA